MAAIAHLNRSTTLPALRLVPPLCPRSSAVYARRRLAVALLVLLVGVLALRLVGGLAAPTDSVGTTSGGEPGVTVRSPAAYGASATPVPAGAIYVVQPGDTVWSIARALAPGGDIRATVDRLAGLNGGAALEVGQHLRLS